MARDSADLISIKGKKAHFHTPAKDVTINLIGTVGDAIVVFPKRFYINDRKVSLPNGEKVEIPYLIGKITEVIPCKDSEPNVSYSFEAYIDMEDGTKYAIRGHAAHDATFGHWKIAPYCNPKAFTISDYRRYTAYAEERASAYEAFNNEWDAKNPMKLK